MPLLNYKIHKAAHLVLLAAAILVTGLAVPMTTDLIMNPVHGFIISLIVGGIIWAGVALCWSVWLNNLEVYHVNVPQD